MKILSSFNHPHVAANPYDFLFPSVKSDVTHQMVLFERHNKDLLSNDFNFNKFLKQIYQTASKDSEYSTKTKQYICCIF